MRETTATTQLQAFLCCGRSVQVNPAEIWALREEKVTDRCNMRDKLTAMRQS
jgi:hypothetical protein